MKLNEATYSKDKRVRTRIIRTRDKKHYVAFRWISYETSLGDNSFGYKTDYYLTLKEAKEEETKWLKEQV